jgi:hypothetical protein
MGRRREFLLGGRALPAGCRSGASLPVGFLGHAHEPNVCRIRRVSEFFAIDSISRNAVIPLQSSGESVTDVS